MIIEYDAPAARFLSHLPCYARLPSKKKNKENHQTILLTGMTEYASINITQFYPFRQSFDHSHTKLASEAKGKHIQP